LSVKPLVALLMLVSSATVMAQESDPFDPAADFEIANEPVSPWRPFGELLLRGDRVTGLPGGRADLERLRARGVFGVRWQGESGWSFGVAGLAALGSDSNAQSLINNDVTASDHVGLAEAWVRWSPNEFATLQLGKSAATLDLSPMLWDGDLRPIGAALRLSGDGGDFSRWQLDLTHAAPDPLRHEGARLSGAQLGWSWHEGAPFSAGVMLGWLRFSEIDTLARAGLGRGNSLFQGRYRHGYRLLDAQAWLRWQVAERPLEFRLDRVHNLDSAQANDGTRASLIYGDRVRVPGWELGWAWERIERDAVLAAVNSDDWWFHTAMRGHMPWVGYGFRGHWSMRLAGFFETRDGLDDRTRRLLLDLEARW
jgi:hypothetical protein